MFLNTKRDIKIPTTYGGCDIHEIDVSMPVIMVDNKFGNHDLLFDDTFSPFGNVEEMITPDDSTVKIVVHNMSDGMRQMMVDRGWLVTRESNG